MKSFFASLFFLLLFHSLFSQDGLHVGFGVLPQSTWITNLQDEDTDWDSFTYKATWGYSAFGKIGYNFGPPLGVHAYLIYSKQGQRHTSKDAGGVIHNLNRDLTYVKVPIMLAVNSHNGGKKRGKQPILFCFGGGPMICWLIRANYTDNGKEKYPGADVKQLFKPMHWGAAFYLGWDFKLGSEYVYLNTRLQGDHSFGNIENKEAIIDGVRIYPANRPVTHNFNMGITVGLTFIVPTESSGGHWRN